MELNLVSAYKMQSVLKKCEQIMGTCDYDKYTIEPVANLFMRLVERDVTGRPMGIREKDSVDFAVALGSYPKAKDKVEHMDKIASYLCYF